MAKKFKVNDHVRVIATGEEGIIKGRDVITEDGTKRVKIEYIVKFGDGFSNWKSFNKRELEKIVTNNNSKHEYFKLYDVVDGYKITMYAKVFNYNTIYNKERVFTMGYSIYNPNDEFNEALGIRIARKRSRTSPFCNMSSYFNGEFNAATVNALMDIKAEYIKNNFDKFINKHSK